MQYTKTFLFFVVAASCLAWGSGCTRFKPKQAAAISSISPQARAALQKLAEQLPPFAQNAVLSPPWNIAPRTPFGNGGKLIKTMLAAGPQGLTARKIWLYLPKAAQTRKVRCIVVAPGGSHLWDGQYLDENNYDEDERYLNEGFAVVACEVDGYLPEGQAKTVPRFVEAANQFAAARVGITNMQAAISVAERLPWVDRKHIYVAGHSSAATIALQTAAYDKRVAGCIALAPPTNVPAFVGEAPKMVEKAGAADLCAVLDALSPHNNVPRMIKPLFIACANDDSVVDPATVKSFAQQVMKTNKRVMLHVVPTGDHYNAMMQQGIPAAANWVRQQP